ncbi:uncharacterized protein LOC127790951 [Diospyros lotus]|uniref:uncharacterized protein LOC127790951 n=1 Tax=Diospyros lotus TaxID=55363 RepID=UPI00225A8994|nr:uncharacterized protein LOC127790951 [Diospyros lotus]
MTVPLPDGFCPPYALEPYDGTTDPQDHLTTFSAAMLISESSDPIMCRTFPSTLRKSAMLWFSSLEPNSIHDFSELATHFLTHFSTSRDHRQTLTSLINLKQGEHEPLRAFMNRFFQEALQIKDLNLAISLHAIMAGLRVGPFVDSLARKPPATLVDLRTWLAGYINIEEASTIQRAKIES